MLRQALALPPYAAADVELQSVLIRAKPFSDPEGLSPPCFRCGGASPLLPPAGSGGGGGACGGCGAAFVVSPLTWEVLPAVEFELEEGITEAEALVGLCFAEAQALGCCAAACFTALTRKKLVFMPCLCSHPNPSPAHAGVDR